MAMMRIRSDSSEWMNVRLCSAAWMFTPLPRIGTAVRPNGARSMVYDKLSACRDKLESLSYTTSAFERGRSAIA
ncbi:MAG TPA: hypothetical protein VJ901_06490 [Thermoanaerobaculia bacterium]|nr:hypothetical protein [Thermoanaerobaculia bacterium]